MPPARASAYRCGEAWSILLEHASGRTALIQGSAGFLRGALTDRAAEVAYLGVGQLGHQDPGYIREYWRETVQAVGARRVVLIHWDDFFRPLTKPLRTLPHLMETSTPACKSSSRSPGSRTCRCTSPPCGGARTRGPTCDRPRA
jgi:L-ascorbate metabolism protein UlaG (beta-lactamase superfamily)